MGLIAYIKNRLRERSTWLGIGAAGSAGLASVGQYLTPAEAHIIAGAVVVAGGVAAIIPTSGAPKNPGDGGVE